MSEDPLSARFECRYSGRMRRDNWSVRAQTESSMSCDAGNFHIHACVRAYEGGQTILERCWEENIPRDDM